MNGQPTERRIDVAARDQTGQLLAGTMFAFQLAGEAAGAITSSDGRGDYTLPAADPGPLKVTATYKGETRSETIDLSQSSFTFIFQQEQPMPDKPRKSGLMLTFLLILIGIPVGLILLFRPAPTSETKEAAAQIARDCAGGIETRNEAKVAAGLSGYLTQATGQTSVQLSDVGTITAKIAQDENGLKFYQAYTQCLKDQTQSWLQLKGVRVVSSNNSGNQPMGPAPPQSLPGASVPVLPGALTGWSYYEEYNGRSTEDGVLRPPGATTLVSYADVEKGIILKSLHGFKVRNGPNGDSEVIKELGAAVCVKVLSAPSHPVPVSAATSGGYLEVARVRCP
jgi:hypothetical protein